MTYEIALWASAVLVVAAGCMFIVIVKIELQPIED